MKKVLIIGGGFAGVQAAIEFKKYPNFDVTLISDRDYFFLYPISIWVPTDLINFEDAKVSLNKIRKLHNFNLVIDQVQSINSKNNIVCCSADEYSYDYLIVAFGAGKMKHNGIENTLSICGNPEVSKEIKRRFMELVEKGEGSIAVGFGGNPLDKSAVRGGPAYEMIFNLHNYLKKRKLRNKFQLSFFAPMEKPGERMGKKSAEAANSMLSNLNINKYFGKKISAFQKDGVIFEDNSKLNSDLTVFIPASNGHPVVANSDLPINESGFIKIDDSCLVENTKNVYAVGDAAAIEGSNWIAKQGHIAEIMARVAVHNIIETESASGRKEGYQKHLSIICVMDTGNGAAFVFRNTEKAFMIPLPILGHYLKKAWGFYSKLTKSTKFPRIPGL